MVIKRAFTLIEMLVVIAIISILAALLMPALSVARSHARSTRCRSRLNNIGQALYAYTVDHNEMLPGIGDYTGTWFFGSTEGPDKPVNFHKGYLSLYVSNSDEVWQCPEFGWGNYVPRAKGPSTGYAYNYHYLNYLVEEGDWSDPDYKYWWKGRGLTIVKKPSNTVLFGDSATNWMGPLQENWFWTPPSQALLWGEAYTHFRHRRTANVLWVDGHVSTMSPDPVLELDEDYLGVICDTEDKYFDPKK